VLAKPGERIQQVYFPTAGIISLVVELGDGQMIETGMIGNDGALGGGAALDGALMLNKGASCKSLVTRLRPTWKP
jgi:hypothetical protein